MITISLCMIVKNEEAVLERCLNSIKKSVDEIIILDTGSTDRTKKIAKKFTDLVYDFEWIYDFSAARNKAYSYATKDYQMWMDADDIILEKDLEKLIKLKSTLDSDIDIVTMKYNTNFDENENPILTSTRERLTKREKNYIWQDPVHECIPLSGNLLHSDIAICHKKIYTGEVSTRNLDIYLKLEQNTTELTPRQQYYYARELKDHGQYAKAIYYFEKFLRKGKGWFEDNIATCYNLSICYQQTADYDKILPILNQSFIYDSPRAEICTEIGYYYKNLRDFHTARKWFHLAAGLEKPASLGFILTNYWGYIPNIEACICCCELGDYKKAEKYYKRAAFYKPDSEAVLIMKDIFDRI